MENNIAYKVVVKNNRTSILTQGKYKLTYNKGEIVNSVPGSLGIMVFDSKMDADRYLNTKRILIKVRPIGERKVPLYVCENPSKYENRLENYYKKGKDKQSTYESGMYLPPSGTSCYPSVEVLD